MIYLTKEEEIELLNSARAKYVGNGSSRAAFLIDYNGKKAILKMFIENAGFAQTFGNEINVYMQYPQYVAEIYAIGHNCIIEEYLEEDDGVLGTSFSKQFSYQEYVDYMYDCVSEEDRNTIELLSKEVYYDALELIDNLSQISNESCDADQVGYSKDRQCYVAYDFGYNAEYSWDSQVGGIDFIIADIGIDGIIDLAIKQVIEDYEFEGLKYKEEDSEDE